MKKRISITISIAFLAICFSVTKGNANTYNNTTDSNIINSYNYTNDEQKIADDALKSKSGKEAAKTINKLHNEAFDKSVHDVLDKYYDNNGNSNPELNNFCKHIDDRADKILKDYADAAKERQHIRNLDYDPQTIIVTFDSETTDEEINKTINSLSDGGEIINNTSELNESLPDYKKERIKKAYNKKRDKIVTVELSKDQTTDKATAEYENLNIVKNVSKNEIFDAASAYDANDTYLGRQWYLDRINAQTAWKTVNNVSESNEIWIAVIDSGVDINHEDLKGKILKNYSVDVTGKKPVKLTDMKTPYISRHGTIVTGIIAANVNNNKGIAGVDGLTDNNFYYSCKIMAIQAGYNYEWEKPYHTTHFKTEDELKAIKYAVDNGAEIINMSFGGLDEYKKEFQQMINYARDAEVVVVAAAGNNYTDGARYPSDYNNVLSVIALDESNKKADYSNYGYKKDISAPGNNILSCFPENTYDIDKRNGTSYAAPMVSATAAMIKAINYSLSPSEIEYIIKVTATDIGDKGKDKDTGFGLLNTGFAVQTAAYLSYKNKTPKISKITPVSSSSLCLKWNYIANEEQMGIYRSESENGPFIKVGKVHSPFNNTVYYTDKNLESGKTYYYKIRGKSACGNGYKYGNCSDIVSCTTP